MLGNTFICFLELDELEGELSSAKTLVVGGNS